MDPLHALLASTTFWQQTVVLATGALGSLIALVWIAMRLASRQPRRRTRLALDERGAAEAVDFVLTFPLLLGFMFLFVQFVMAANASLIVHYAAFAAARAARVHLWERTPGFIQAYIQGQRGGWLNGTNQQGITMAMLSAQNYWPACQAAADAARLVLIAAAPSGIPWKGPNYEFTPPGNSVDCYGSSAQAHKGDYILQIVQLVPQALPNAIAAKAAYAFSNVNTLVTIQVTEPPGVFTTGDLDPGFRVDALPVAATVKFRYTPTLPLPAMPAVTQLGPDGRLSSWMTATVEVL